MRERNSKSLKSNFLGGLAHRIELGAIGELNTTFAGPKS